MSTHPNAILVLALTPDDLARKTYRAICADNDVNPYEESPSIDVAGNNYTIVVMEEPYLEGLQISGLVGDIILYDMVTYGYGKTITWQDLQAAKDALEAWAKKTCEKHKCGYRFYVTANYW